jgi:hypothetical protein
MTPLFEVLADKQLPGWLLVKNAVISGDDGSGHRIASFDEHYFSDSFDELKAKIAKSHTCRYTRSERICFLSL